MEVLLGCTDGQTPLNVGLSHMHEGPFSCAWLLCPDISCGWVHYMFWCPFAQREKFLQLSLHPNMTMSFQSRGCSERKESTPWWSQFFPSWEAPFEMWFFFIFFFLSIFMSPKNEPIYHKGTEHIRDLKIHWFSYSSIKILTNMYRQMYSVRSFYICLIEVIINSDIKIICILMNEWWKKQVLINNSSSKTCTWKFLW